MSDLGTMAGPDTRIEADSMGEMEVPIDAKWAASTQRAVLNFPISGMTMSPEFVKALGLVKWACANANKDLGELPEDKADAIAEAAFAIFEGEHAEHFPVDVFQTGSGTSSNMNANEVIANIASGILNENVHPNDDVNRGQSSNDIIPTTMHVAAAQELKYTLVPALEYLAECLEQKAQEFDDVVKIGRTHLMDAVPIRLSQEFGGYARQIELGLERIEAARGGLYELAQEAPRSAPASTPTPSSAPPSPQSSKKPPASPSSKPRTISKRRPPAMPTSSWPAPLTPSPLP